MWKLQGSSNRTFMELKLRWLCCTSKFCGRSNRTFMELKLIFVDGDVEREDFVLIVPLWN